MTLSIRNKVLMVDDGAPELVKHLRSNFDTALTHRKNTGVDDRLEKDLLQAMSQYCPKVKNAFTLIGEPDVYFPLGAMKARAQTSWLKDVISASKDKMWTVEPTPIPELPSYVVSEIRDAVLADLQEELSQGITIDFKTLTEIVNRLTDEQFDREYAYAKDKAERMSRLILDQWTEAEFLNVWDEVISDLARRSVSIVKGPVEVQKRVVKWTADGGLVEKYEVEPTMYRVPSENFYPMPDVGHDVNSGTGIFELAIMTMAELIQAKKVNNYNSEAIDNILNVASNGYQEANVSDKWVKDILNRSTSRTPAGGFGTEEGYYHTIKYYGLIQVEILKSDESLEIPSTLKDEDYINVEAWIIKDQLIYLNLEPYPLGNRPFCVIPREFVSGSIWGGESLQSMIETPARTINALVRQQILNMGYAAGPIGEAEAVRFSGKPPKYVEPRRIYSVSPGTHGEKALRFTDIPARTADYITTINFYLTQADLLSGIPSFIEGSPAGVRGLTNGQTEFSFGNASRGIDSLLQIIDRFFIEKMLQRYYYRNLIAMDDDSIKGDVKFKARGLSGVFKKQLKRQESIAAVQMLGQLRDVMPSYVTEESFLKLVEPMFENLGLDIKDVLNKNSTTENVDPGNLQTQVEAVMSNLNVEPTENPQVPPGQAR